MKYSTNDITAIILAGGQGTRFNKQNKGLIKINDETFVSHLLNKLSSQSKTQIISANNDILQYAKYEKKVIEDLAGDYQGPLSGIISCKPHIDTSLVLTIPCDSPMIPDDISTRLLQAYNANDTTESAKICVVHDGERLQNLFMLFNSSLLEDMESYFNNNGRSVFSWIKQHQHKAVDFSDKALHFTNINDQTSLDSLLNLIALEQVQ